MFLDEFSTLASRRNVQVPLLAHTALLDLSDALFTCNRVGVCAPLLSRVALKLQPKENGGVTFSFSDDVYSMHVQK